MPPRSGRSVLLLTYAAPAAAAAAAVALVARDPHTGGSWGTCPSLLLFGVYCPGCGSLRGTHDLLTGDLSGAVGHNMLLLPAVVWLTWWWLAEVTARHPHLTRVRRPPESARFIVAMMVTVALYTVARNLPGSPLAP